MPEVRIRGGEAAHETLADRAADHAAHDEPERCGS
jgi:hypothetical protein